MNYIIRYCQHYDLPKLVKLCEAHAKFEGSTYNSDSKLDLLDTALFGSNPTLHCLVVDVGETIVGYASYTFDFSTWDASTFLYLDCLYLEFQWRGKKIGENIIGKLKEIASQNNCINIQWQTPTFNENAIRFYLNQGATKKEKVRFTLSPKK